jgi:hypothetical protein
MTDVALLLCSASRDGIKTALMALPQILQWKHLFRTRERAQGVTRRASGIYNAIYSSHVLAIYLQFLEILEELMSGMKGIFVQLQDDRHVAIWAHEDEETRGGSDPVLGEDACYRRRRRGLRGLIADGRSGCTGEYSERGRSEQRKGYR